MQRNQPRSSPLELSPSDFRTIGYRLVDDIADFLEKLPKGKVNPAESPSQVRKFLGVEKLPVHGTSASKLMEDAAALLFDHSLFNGHPAFFGYITSSAAPIGALGDFLAASVNSNVGSFQLAPAATEIERQTVRWIAEMIGYPTNCGGIMVSGGNMANFVCFLVGRYAKIPWDVRKDGVQSSHRLRIYTSAETHTWIKKAGDLFGLGTDAIRWIPTDEQLRMDVSALEKQIEQDQKEGDIPLMVIGTAGSVSTGAVDPLRRIGELCRKHGLWYHIDGAYGGFAAMAKNVPEELYHLSLADSIAIDPHKWLYAPIEAGCVLMKNPQKLIETFSYHVSYYRFGETEGEQPVNFFEYGPQNSRGFRALKVWLGIRQVGLEGYRKMISDDIALAAEMATAVSKHPELQLFTNDLSITTFRYVPVDMRSKLEENEEYLNTLNETLLTEIQNSGEAYLSNAVIRGSFVLRACIVNFRTTMKEINLLPELAVKFGNKVDNTLRSQRLSGE